MRLLFRRRGRRRYKTDQVLRTLRCFFLTMDDTDLTDPEFNIRAIGAIGGQKSFQRSGPRQTSCSFTSA